LEDEEVKKMTARWVCRSICQCPYCNADVPLTDNKEPPEDFNDSNPVLPEKFVGLEVFCPDCLETFALDETDEDIICFWNVSLGSDCPFCGEYIELAEGRKIDEVERRLQSGEFDLFFDMEMICPECAQTFTIGEPEDTLPGL
jgi:hypothetical protein